MQNFKKHLVCKNTDKVIFFDDHFEGKTINIGLFL